MKINYIYQLVISGIRVIRNEGWASFWFKMRNMLRSYYLSPGSACYRWFVPSKVLRALDKMVLAPRFHAATDWSALSVLSMLIMVCKPNKILELGTYNGFSSILFAGLLSKNQNAGKIYTVEMNEEYQSHARYNVKKAGVGKYIEFILGSSTDPRVVELLAKNGPYDFLYIDSSHAYGETLKELKIYLEDETFTNISTLVALHDAGSSVGINDPTKMGGVPKAIEEWFTSGNNRERYQLFIFEPPLYPHINGLAIIRKKIQKDF